MFAQTKSIRSVTAVVTCFIYSFNNNLPNLLYVLLFEFLPFCQFLLMCYIIFTKCKINQHINTRDTVCFYLTLTMGVTCGIFFYRVNNTKTDWRQFDMGFFTHRNPTFCFMKCKLGEKFHFFILSKPDIQMLLAILSLRNRSHIHPYTHTNF